MAKKKFNKYYVGAGHIANAVANGYDDDWTHSTMAKAVEHAKELIEDEGKDCCIIVQIVKIVRPRKNPVIVEDV